MRYTFVIKWAVLVVAALFQASSIALDVLIVCYGTLWIGVLLLAADTILTAVFLPCFFLALFRGEPADAHERQWNDTVGIVSTVLLVVALVWSGVMLCFVAVAKHTSVGDWSLLVRSMVGSVPVCLLVVGFFGFILLGGLYTLVEGLVQIIKDADITWLSFCMGACARACHGGDPEQTKESEEERVM